LTNTKGSYLSNASTVAKLDTFLPNVLIPRKMIVMIKKLTIRKNIKRVNPNTKINYRIKRKTFILKKTIAQKLELTLLKIVIMKMKKIHKLKENPLVPSKN
jgi:hypothetical protein